MIRVRLAPSPTGNLHLGTARTALFNFLFAKKNKGKFILRIEDTDRSRSTQEYEKDIIENLKWLRLFWDEGPIASLKVKSQKSKIKNYIGECGPYRQTERIEIYQRYAKKLIKEDKAYYCFCTPAELENERKTQQKKKLAPKYSGRCKNLTKEGIQKFKKEGRKPAIRFKIDPQIVEFEDLIHGKVEFDAALEGDFIILKSDSFPIFHFAVVVDDAKMRISHVIRGEDHLSNTPKQILVQEALGFQKPQYAHLPLIFNPDKTKMSKRYGAVTISDFRKMGYLPEALVNYLALLGWTGGDKEILDLESLIKKFDLKQVQKSPAIFYREKLDWVNGEWIRKLRVRELSKRIRDFGYKNITEKMTSLIQERIKRLDEIPFWTDFFFKEIEYDPASLKFRGASNQRVKEILEMVLEDFKNSPFKSDKLKMRMQELARKSKLGLREFLYPLRIAITGRTVSPPLFESMEILGKEESLRRTEAAIKKL